MKWSICFHSSNIAVVATGKPVLFTFWRFRQSSLWLFYANNPDVGPLWVDCDSVQFARRRRRGRRWRANDEDVVPIGVDVDPS